MKAFYKRLREYVPMFSLVMICLTLISLIIYILVLNSVKFADFFNYNIASVVRQIMAYATSFIPFSTAELFIILSPILLSLLVVLIVKQAKKGKKSSIRLFLIIICILLYIFITFVWTYSSGFHTTPLDKKLELDKKIPSKEELNEATAFVVSQLNELSEKIEYDDQGSSLSPYSYKELSEKICNAYEKYEKDHGIIRNFDSKIKPIILSEPLTYTHISGIYTFMTGEGNVNVNYPDFIVTTSVAHEMSHQRGVAREDEANITAFIVLMNAEDEFLRYCAYLDLYRYLANALYSADKDAYKNLYLSLASRVRQDLVNYSNFFKKYANSKASDVTNKVNDSYLQANGQSQGIKSYGMVVETTCAYLFEYKMN